MVPERPEMELPEVKRSSMLEPEVKRTGVKIQ
jgi:hypothetical protein